MAAGEVDDAGDVKAFFEVNGQPRVIRVSVRQVKGRVSTRPKTQDGNSNHISAHRCSFNRRCQRNSGQKVKLGCLLLTIEAMKMETGLDADRQPTVKEVLVTPGSQIEAKDLLVELE